MIQIILNFIIPFVLTAIFTFIAKELKENKKSNEAIRSSMVLLLRSQITSKCETYLKMGYIPSYARNCIDDLFSQYKILGGNHGVEKLVELTFSLPPMKGED